MLTILYWVATQNNEHVRYNMLKRNSMYDVNVSDNTERKESGI